MTTNPQKITFGELRESGVREVLIYCRDHHCSHSTTISAERWPDHLRLSDVEPGFVCTACGKRGAEMRPKFPQARMGTAQQGYSLSRREVARQQVRQGR